jgi:hypothetical protein
VQSYVNQIFIMLGERAREARRNEEQKRNRMNKNRLRAKLHDSQLSYSITVKKEQARATLFHLCASERRAVDMVVVLCLLHDGMESDKKFISMSYKHPFEWERSFKLI